MGQIKVKISGEQQGYYHLSGCDGAKGKAQHHACDGGRQPQQVIRISNMRAPMRFAEDHVAQAEETEDGDRHDLHAKEIERPLSRPQGHRQMKPMIKRNEKNCAEQKRPQQECGKDDAKAGGLDLLTSLDLSTLVVEGHLHVGVGLHTVVQRADVAHSRAQCEPLAVKQGAKHMEKKGGSTSCVRTVRNWVTFWAT